MAFQLRLDEMICVLQELRSERASEYVRELEALGNKAINEICSLLDIIPGEATFDLGFVAAPIYARSPHQELPETLSPYDNVEEWSAAHSAAFGM